MKKYDYYKPDSGSTTHRFKAVKPSKVTLASTKSVKDLLKSTMHHFKKDEKTKINNFFN